MSRGRLSKLLEELRKAVESPDFKEIIAEGQRILERLVKSRLLGKKVARIREIQTGLEYLKTQALSGMLPSGVAMQLVVELKKDGVEVDLSLALQDPKKFAKRIDVDLAEIRKMIAKRLFKEAR